MNDIMYKNGLTRVWVYRDSVKYYFQGNNADMIIIYNENSTNTVGEKIIDKVYLLKNQLN